MTARANCRAIYNGRLDRTGRFDSLDVSGPEDTNPTGAPISNAESVSGYQALRDDLGPDNIWYLFQSQRDWEFARWAKNQGASSTAVTELLAIDGVAENLGLSYRNIRELNRIIDEEMPGRPRFKCNSYFAPERHYQDVDHTAQVFNEMYTGNWWWSVQRSLELRRPGATVIPVIISSDKTQLTLFRSKSALPHILVTFRQLDLTISATRLHCRRALANLFHSCMRKCLSPIESYGETGIAMATGDRIWYRCHPIFVTFIGDYPEQALVACTYNGRCPKCIVPRAELRRQHTNIFSLSDACHEAGLKPTYHPFWEQSPIHQYISFDHPRYIASASSRHLDLRRSMHTAAAYPQITMPDTFTKALHGFRSSLAKNIKTYLSIILGVVVDMPLPGNQSSARFKLSRTVRALLDFIYLSQYHVHTTESLKAMDAALCRFHENKDIFIELGVWEHFNIPKLHSLLHYTRSISLFGAADNYNTEHSERLHIDLTKNAYHATNFKNEYKQMTTWLERQEAMHQHTAFIEWCNGNSVLPSPPLAYPRPNLMLYPFLATHPSEKGVTFEDLFDRYGAADFQDALADFIVQHNDPGLSTAVAWRRADNTLIPFRRVSVFCKVKFTNCDYSDPRITVDVLHVRPGARNRRESTSIPGRFDTALVKHGNRFRVVQIRVVFQLLKSAIPSIFTSSRPAPMHLAYVEWFSPPSSPDESHGMYRVSRSHRNECRLASIIPLEEVCRSVQLFPVFGSVFPQQWQGSTVLEECRTFYINPFLDRHLYQNLNVINERL
ncbi:hypothetical protein H4582DRAFT_2107200 [Lactarius indigo]|nr:hypothetical protein H4582DRAFT_2107200 [Lactarius indigo]